MRFERFTAMLFAMACTVATFDAGALTIQGVDVGQTDLFVGKGGDAVAADPIAFINGKLGTSLAASDITTLTGLGRVCSDGVQGDSICRIDLGENTAYDFVLLEYERRAAFPNANNFFLYTNRDVLRYAVHDLVRNNGGPGQLCADPPRVSSTHCVSGVILSARVGNITEPPNPVPAPGAVAMFGLAALGFGLRGRRR